MEDILKQLVRTAMLEKVAAVQELTNGMQLLAYPLAAGVLVALGYAAGAAGAVSSVDLLRRRSDNLKLYAPWLPAMFADGSLYVVRRLTEADPGASVPPLSTDELMTAVELLA